MGLSPFGHQGRLCQLCGLTYKREDGKILIGGKDMTKKTFLYKDVEGTNGRVKARSVDKKTKAYLREKDQ